MAFIELTVSVYANRRKIRFLVSCIPFSTSQMDRLSGRGEEDDNNALVRQSRCV